MTSAAWTRAGVAGFMGLVPASFRGFGVPGPTLLGRCLPRTVSGMAAAGTGRDAVIEIDRFTMTFGRATVVDDLSFQVGRGETFGFLGSNGSGKTTTIRALLGIYQPTAGTLLVNGRIFTPRQGSGLGYLPEERGLYKKEKVIDVMVYFGRLKGLTAAAARAWSMDYLQRVSLTEKATTRIDKLSGGQQQKIQLGVTIMNEPDLLILDEPTKGFDPLNRRLLMAIIEDQKQAGATVLMITHQMEEVERLCDRVIMLKDGRSQAYGTIEQIQDHYGGRTVRLRYAGQLPASSPHWQAVLVQRNYAELSLADGADEAGVLRGLVEAGVAVSSFTTTRKSMDEIFVTIYGEPDQGQPTPAPGQVAS